MLNNKKSLLQRARIAMLAIVTILSISGSFAMTPRNSAAMQTWGVLQTNASTYRVTALTANSHCDEAPSQVCIVRSEATRNPTTKTIPTAGALIVEDGKFVK